MMLMTMITLMALMMIIVVIMNPHVFLCVQVTIIMTILLHILN